MLGSCRQNLKGHQPLATVTSCFQLLPFAATFIVAAAFIFALLPLTPAQATSGTFSNPLSSTNVDCCQDPTAYFKDGYYYYVHGEGEALVIYKSKTLEDILAGPLARTKITLDSSFSTEPIWAPEIFYASGNWYIYASYRESGSVPRKSFVMQADTQDPMGAWTNLGELSLPGWGSGTHYLDANFFEIGTSQYIVFAGNIAGDTAGWVGIYIAPLTNPYTVSSAPVLIGRPGYAVATDTSPNSTYSWEGSIMENPAVVIKSGKVNLIYSANDYQSSNYTTGLMTTTGSVLSASSWTKKSSAIFDGTAGVIGPGGVSFTKSPDSTEDWIVYHAKVDNNYNGARHAMAQKITVNGSNEVVFGTPQGNNTAQNRPSGEPDTDRSYRVYFEAEQAELINTNAPSTRLLATGFQSVGGLNSSTSGVTFNWVNVPAAGNYRLLIRYSTNWFVSATQPIYLNGSSTPVNAFLAWGYGWDDFKTVSLDVSLNAGVNTLKFGNNNGRAEIDSILLPRLEGEHATLVGNATVMNRTNGHNGADVGNLNWPTDCIIQDQKVIALRNGGHTLRVRASAGWGAATHAVTVNGANAGTLSYPGTADWNTFTTATLGINLNVGYNTISICKSGSGYAEVDSFEWY